MGYIELPDSMFANSNPAPAAPPPDPAVAREQAIADTTRAEEALNGFLAARQHALFEAPDAFYRTQGSDAIHAAPLILGKLAQLRDDSLDGLANDAQRDRLGRSLDAHMQLARDDIARHVAEQSLAWQRRTAQDRIALLTKEAAYHHNDDDRLDALGIAAANAARAHARVGDTPLDQQAEDAAAAIARSGVLSSAVQARLDRGDRDGANALLTRVQAQLDPDHAVQLAPQLAQSPAIGPHAASSPPPSTKSSMSENERDAAQSLLDEQAAKAKGELDTLASTPRTPDDDKYKGPLPADWEKRLPDATLKKLNESAAEYGVPRNLIAAILWEESTFKEKASAGANAEGQGMAGMSLGAQQDLITKAKREKNLERESELKSFDRMKGPAAVSMAAEYLKQLYDDNGQHWPSAVLAYRLGRTAVHNWLGGSSDSVKSNTEHWELSNAYIRKIFQGRSHLFDAENAPEFP